mmetsp:Transcript_19405/g.46884  ORF Transcript_19405/g.46884 Transcript_19405/m.46884 type:complete len:644 (-) Transcript_19405:49-1980(-)
MAGTRLLISSLATFTLICNILISLHVGFCPHHDNDHHSRRMAHTSVSDDDDNGVRKPSPFKSANVLGVSPKSLIPLLPYVTDGTQNEVDTIGIFQSINPLLCPWTLISTLLLADSDDSVARFNQSAVKPEPASTTTSTKAGTPHQYFDSNLEGRRLDLRVKFVIEDIIENQNKMESTGDGDDDKAVVDDDVGQGQGSDSSDEQGSTIEKFHHPLREKILTVVKDMILNLPSYIYELEQVSVSFTDTPIDVLSVDEPILQPSVVSNNPETIHRPSSPSSSKLPTDDEIKKIWSYVVRDERTDRSGNEKDNDLDDRASASALLIVYLPSIRNFATFSSEYSREHHNSNDIDSDDDDDDDKGKDETDDSLQGHQLEELLVVPVVRSFKVEENTAGTVVDTESCSSNRPVTSHLLIPSIEYTGKKDRGLSRNVGDVERLMTEKIVFHFERWLTESIISFFGTTEIDTVSSSLEIWKLLHRLWREQAMNAYHSIDNTTQKDNVSLTHPILLDDMEDDELVMQILQAKIADLQIAYESIETDEKERRRRKLGHYDSPRRGKNHQPQRQKLLFVPDFPIEHYAAILLPLIFPLLLPLLISTIKEYKRLKTKKKEKQDGVDNNNNNNNSNDINSNEQPNDGPGVVDDQHKE